MKRVVKIRADDVELDVTIEGTAPIELFRVLAYETGNVAFDFFGSATVSDEVRDEDVEK